MQFKSGGYSEAVEGRKEEEEEEEDDDEMLDLSENANLLDKNTSKTNSSLVSWLNNDTSLLQDALLVDPPPSFEHVTAQVHPKRQRGLVGASSSHELKCKASNQKNKYNRNNDIKGLDNLVDVGCCSKDDDRVETTSSSKDEPPSFEEAIKKMGEVVREKDEKEEDRVDDDDDDDILLV